jgi:hypothetical protein
MPSANDGDDFYTLLKKMAYDLLVYVVTTPGSVPVLAGYLRHDLAVFEKLFCCTCNGKRTNG